MKKLSLLLSLLLIFSVFILSASAESCVNSQLEAGYCYSRPTVDGVISMAEYGDYPSLTYSESNKQFTHNDDHDEYKNWDFDFYITWDEENLYMAWEVKTFIHQPVAENSLDDMWRYSSLRFIITPSDPDSETTQLQQNNNYLEIGFCQLDNGNVGRKIFNCPKGVFEGDISENEWTAAVCRDEDNKTTTYEVAVPWAICAVPDAADNTRFGLSFAVAAQSDYNVKKGVIEWNDAILGEKNADNAGVITLIKNTCPPGFSFPEISEYSEGSDVSNTDESSDASVSESSVTCAEPGASSESASAKADSDSEAQNSNIGKEDTALLEKPMFWVIVVGAIAVIAAVAVLIKKRR